MINAFNTPNLASWSKGIQPTCSAARLIVGVDQHVRRVHEICIRRFRF